jgi:hypothetical protein
MPDREHYLQLAKILLGLAEQSREAAVRELLIERANEYMLMAAAAVDMPRDAADMPPGAADTPVQQAEQQQQKKAEDES